MKGEKSMKGENDMKGDSARTFEELHMYQRARELTNAIYGHTRCGPFAQDRGLSDQIRRASVSIMSNIAEGFERGASTEFIQFLYIAKGSCGEVRAQLQIARVANFSNRLSPFLFHCVFSRFVAHLAGR